MLRRVTAAFPAVVILAIAILLASHANAQVAGATLSGTITDPSGAAIAGAKLTITNTATGVSRDVTADAAGFYSAPNLLPGPYEVTVAASGFSTTKQSNLTLTVGGQQILNVALKIGEATQTVLVTEAAPLVQLGSSTISAQVESKEVLELPLNGRDWASLATLSPGVNGIETQMPYTSGAVRGNRGFGAQLTISGGRPTQNNYRVDGNSINDYGNGGPGSVLGVSLGVDAIQEFSVLTGNYSAEYGRTSGGVVNAITKSGTNAFHGDLYEFLRNQALDANDFFSNAAGLPKYVYRRNQFGGAAGGPIRKDRTFIFGDYEGIRQSQGSAVNSYVPTDAARNGDLTSGHVNVDPLIKPYLALYPHVNVPGSIVGNRGLYSFAGVRIAKENFYTTRLDHKISDKDSLFATYNYDDTPFTQQDSFNNLNILSQTTRHIAALEESHVFTPALVNNARLGFNRNAVINYQATSAINPAANDPSLAVFPGGDNPSIRISGGFAAMGAGLNGQFSHHDWNSIQFYDDAFLTKGTQSLKFGFALERMRYNFFQKYNPEGIVRFASIQNFLTNKPNSFEGGLADPVAPRGLRQTLFGGYVQDDWRVKPRFTLNLGLRYEMTTVLNEVQGRITNIPTMSAPLPFCGTANPALTTLKTPVDSGRPGCTGPAQSYYSNPTTLNFEPRFGFAWDPRGDGKTAVRGGFAIFDILPLPGYYYTQQGIETPFYLTGVITNTPSAPLAGLMGLPGTDPRSAYQKIGPTALTAAYMEPHPHRTYVEQWNINVQRQITPSMTATVGYIGSHGVHMMMRGDDGNMVIPTETPAGFLWPYNPTQANLKVNQYFGGIRFLTYGTGSTYEGLTINVQKRMSHGFQFGASYTYSKAVDDSSATIAGDSFSNTITSWFWFAPKISHGPADFDVTHSAVVNGIWQVPVSSSLHGPAGVLLRGWELSSIFRWNSGVPTTPVIGGDPLGVQNSGSDPFSIPDKVPGCNATNSNFKSNPGGVFLGYINSSCYTLPKASSAIASQCVPFSSKLPGTCSNLLGNAGRNSIVGPHLVNLDFSVYKNFAVRKISESFTVQFRAEFFNVLNHANFAPPLPIQNGAASALFNQDGSATGAGGLTTLVTQPRDIQFALKVIW